MQAPGGAAVNTDGAGFPGGSVVKNLPANAGDAGSISDPGRFHVPQSKLIPCAAAIAPEP